MSELPIVDLNNCDREPIHIPGSIQPHGCLIVLEASGLLSAFTANAPQMLGSDLILGRQVQELISDAGLLKVIERALNNQDEFPELQEATLGEVVLDVIAHRSAGKLIVEFEPRPEDSPLLHNFAHGAQAALSNLQRATNVEQLLWEATREIQRLSGFDRVLCYKFRHDGSGDVVCEVKRDDLESFLGLRYPSSDIPAQARKLYVLNALRFIVDMDAGVSPIEPPSGPISDAPLDLSHAVLRSVSPIHIEYLKNMGVQASMSVSIVRDNALWGLFACHHYQSSKQIPHALRLSCKLVGQIVGLLINQLVSQEQQRALEGFRIHRDQIVDTVRAGDDILRSLVESPELMELVAADGVAVTLSNRVQQVGIKPSATSIAQLVQQLVARDGDIYASSNLNTDLADIESLAPAAGVLAIRYDAHHDGWILWFRKEEIETVRWAGNPDKVYDEGPNGPRLSPRGSFEEYRRSVTGQSAPWEPSDVESATRLRTDLQKIVMARLSEVERARELMAAALSHDLRNPLSAISMSAEIVSLTGEWTTDLNQTISKSTERMKRLIDHMLDFSRVQSGMSLGIAPVSVQVVAQTQKLLRELLTAFPGLEVMLQDEEVGPAFVDPDRYEQALANLLSNARHHGEMGQPVVVVLKGGNSEPLSVTVRNKGPNISDENRANIFNPFKQQRSVEQRNRGGVGLGLFIVHQIMLEHTGNVEILPYEDGFLSFRLTFPPASD